MPTITLAYMETATAFRHIFMTACLMVCGFFMCGCASQPVSVSGAERYPSLPDDAWEKISEPRARILPSGWTISNPSQTSMLYMMQGRSRIRVWAYVYRTESAGASLRGDSGSYQFDADTIVYADDPQGEGECGLAQSRAAREQGRWYYRLLRGSTLWVLQLDGGGGRITDEQAYARLRVVAEAVAQELVSQE